MSNNEYLTEKIVALKQKINAIILAHNYQRPEIQDVADYTGDSLELSRKAAATDADVIVFCGVHFMAETAKIISPQKTVLLPDENAGCPMAEMISVAQLTAGKRKYPRAKVICYVNSNAAIKAISDICCTSANAVQVVQAMDGNDPIIFVPDQYLGYHAMRKSGIKMHLWPGYCPTHMKIRVDDIARQKARYPDAKVVVHPECRPDVIDEADEALSTGGIIHYAQAYTRRTLIVGTETGILHRLNKENASVKYVPLSERSLCPNMKRTTLEKVLWTMEELKPRIEIPEDIRQPALLAVERMLTLT